MILTGKLETDLETVFDFFSKHEAASDEEVAEIESTKRRVLDLFSLLGEADEVTDLPPEHPFFAFNNVRVRESDHPAFSLMVELAKALPMRHFVKDVTFHDRNELRYTPPDRPFTWLLRPTGSTIFWHGDRVRLDTIESASFEGGAYWWDGACLKKVTVAQAKELLDQRGPLR